MAGGFLLGEEPRVAMVWGMWVAPSVRRAGTRQKLLEAVAGWARDAGADRLRLAVTDCEESRPAAEFYRKRGFVEDGECEPLGWNPSLIARFMSRPV
jgi:GNAT superfamily N-acetyltransferase